MAGTLHGRTAVVTGGSRGIGRAVVERLSRDGARVVFGYRTRSADAAEVAAATGARAVRADLTDDDAVDRLTDGVRELDILVCNAAAEFTPTPLAETSDEDYDRLMRVNARSVFRLLRYAARHMRDDGRIIVVSTLNTVLAPAGGALYIGSKGAAEQFTMAAARELGGRGITANVVSPGATDTELLRSTNPPEALEMWKAMTPLGRLGLPADVADVIAFLAGPDSRWLTGQNIRAVGGVR